MRLDPSAIRQQIDNLLLQHPELQDDDVLRADMIEGETDLPEFLRQVEAIRRDAAGMAGGIAITIAELEIRQGRFERREKAMRELAFKLLQWADVRKLELPEATYSVRAGTPRVVIIDSSALPVELCRIVREPLKAVIGAQLKSGAAIPGAHLSNAEPCLSIHTK